jgi:sugar (pentulose or hexulose) kinase
MIRTNTFRTILANVLECEIGIAESGETTALGTLSQVAASLDMGASLAEYAAIRATELTMYEPDTTYSGIYESLYTGWPHKERLLDSFDL